MSDANWHVEAIPLTKCGSTGLWEDTTSDITYPGPVAVKKRRVLGAYFVSPIAITGSTSACWTVNLCAGTDCIATLAFVTSTDATAATPVVMVMQTENSTDTLAIVDAGTALTCSCAETGSATDLHSNCVVYATVAAVEIV